MRKNTGGRKRDTRRKCLGSDCGEVFHSEGPHHRFCGYCNNLNKLREDYYPKSYDNNEIFEKKELTGIDKWKNI